MELELEVRYLRGVGPGRAALLARLGVRTVGDLLRYCPRRHEDRRSIAPLGQLAIGQATTFRGRVVDQRELRPRAGLVISQAVLEDGTGRVRLVWFNQPWRLRDAAPGRELVAFGTAQWRYRELQVQNPEYEVLEGGDLLQVGRMVPVYRLTEGLNQRGMRRLVWQVLEDGGAVIEDPLPEELRSRRSLVPLQRALRGIHFPADFLDLEAARRRLAFDELFGMQKALAAGRRERAGVVKGLRYGPPGALTRAMLERLPFALTAGQRRSLEEIWADLERPEPMYRLLQGDVGSGKTVVAAGALLRAVEAGHQGALMVPTELLAEQHAANLRRLVEPLGVRLDLLTGGQPKREREAVQERLAAGESGVVVGTHALVQEGVRFARLALAVIDEQHRFGVRQRELLPEKGERPDLLVMTATPIPRTLILTLYGDMAVSLIDSLPPGRRPVKTFFLERNRREEAYGFLERQVGAGHLAYVVCPLIEESEAMTARAAAQLADQLRRRFAGDGVGLVHGRMPFREREAVMEEFRTGRQRILVATTVIEVGMDVPEATVMVVEGAERFGLAQLHQLRGRVGRGDAPGYCLLLEGKGTPEARERLSTLAGLTDGFAVAEADLKARGPGEFFGTRQHGLPDLVVADPLRDADLLLEAREEAQLAEGLEPAAAALPRGG